MWSCESLLRSRFILCAKFVFTFSVVSILAVWQYQQMNSAMIRRTPVLDVRNLRLVSPGSFHKKWIIVTALSRPSSQIERLSKIREWKLLIVAVQKTPRNWKRQNVIILDTDIQNELGYQVLKFLPPNTYTSKIIGYLYAIQHGAEFIYDMDDSNAPSNVEAFENDFVLDRVTRGLILSNYNKNVVTNPYVHFGQHSVWPRGFPLNYIGQGYNKTYTVCQMVTPIIQQGIINGEPDVEAIFRLTRGELYTPLDIRFDSSAPPVIIPNGVLAPFNSRNTIFHYDAFWALLLPVSVGTRVTDIWRSYWAQPLLWSIGGNLGFYFTNTTHRLNPNKSYLRDFGEEDQLYKHAEALVEYLVNWRCQYQDLYNCMLQLTSEMADYKMWSSNEIKLMEAWIYDLKSIGYKAPPVQHQGLQNDSSPCLKGKGKTFAMFNPVIQSKTDRDKFRAPLRKFCNFTIKSLPENQADQVPRFVFPSTLLVVTFNNPHYEYIWLLDIIYRPHYPNILYCGHLKHFGAIYDFLAEKEFLDANVKKFSFVHANVGSAEFVYECALRAIDMRYNVNGYIAISDDVLFNFWNNERLNPEEMWIFDSHHLLTLSTALPINQTYWVHWPTRYGFRAIEKALGEIYNQSSEVNPLVKQFRSNRDDYGYNSSIATIAPADIFYFPASKQDILYEVGSILRKNEVYLEISVPFLITGLSAPKDIVRLSGKSLWNEDRDIPFRYFNASHNALHPVKPSQVIANSNLTMKYCDHYVRRILELGGV